MRKFLGPPEGAPVGIFTRDCFSSPSFALIRVLVRFHPILGRSIFYRARARAQFPRSSWERTGWNFCARSLPIFVIWPNYGTCWISCDFVIACFLARLRELPNSQALRGSHWLHFSHATASNIHHFFQLGYLCHFARSREGRSFRAHVRA